jgi:DNA-binding NarL/FixJ family response regulator
MRAAERAPAILVLSDRGLFRDSVVELLEGHGFPRAAGATTAAFLDRRGDRGAPDLVLVDLDREQRDPRDVLHALRDAWPAATVVAVGTPTQLAATASDADGWIAEEPEASAVRFPAMAAALRRPHVGRLRFPMPAAVRKVLPTWQSLTPRERQVLGLLACGLNNDDLADALGVSERAVKAHITHLLEKFGVDRRGQLSLIACHAGLHGDDDGRCQEILGLAS